MKAIIGKKIGMTRIFSENGKIIPVTLIMVEDNIVTQIKNIEKDGYEAVQIALPEEKKIAKPQKGHLAKVNIKSRHIKEVAKLETEVQVGDKVTIDQFTKGENVNVTGISKGKGFAGTVKRHGFHLGPKTHGSDNYRKPGSIGSMYPQRVIKGRRMAGHLGAEQVTVKNLEISHIDEQDKVIWLKGAIPGANKGFVFVWSNND
jgi:large subunit ribosomal protein L3